MKRSTVTEIARHFREMMNEVEFEGEEIVVVRNKKQIARIIPEPTPQTALEIFGDIYRTLDDETAEDLSNQLDKIKYDGKGNKTGTLEEFRNPWAS